MTRSIRQILLLFGWILTTSVLTACSDHDKFIEVDDTVYFDFATLLSNDQDGLVFSIERNDNSPVILNFPHQNIVEDVEDGSRWVIAYVPDCGLPYVSGNGVLRSVSYVYTDSFCIGEETTSMPQNLVSIWRTGKWLNIESIVNYEDRNPETFSLVFDKNTIDTPHPTAYIVYESKYSPESTTKTFYASFNISDFTNSDKYKGIDIIVNTFSGDRKYSIDF